ncbi:protein S-acyltransferase 10 isoform X2 [Populus alba]|uniref:protein S-acyltransferase 10 isoform X2 n=1 Tax=Populus alba TaxID=43335 RepID=UPI00158A10B3|nr:protein S-acyltransferase 10-like isoform X2 [Populus alba]
MSIFNFCYRIVPCLADPARRSSLGLKAALVVLHIVYAGTLFLFYSDLIEKTKEEPWYTAIYLLLFVAALIQYFVTSCSSPGYVLDAMRDLNEKNSLYRRSSMLSKQPASSKSGSFVITVEGSQYERNITGSNVTSWTKLVLDMYPPGTSIRTLTCIYCNVEQPPRAKHCHDCDKCVLQFDHHCVWLGTCIGRGNHCRFWWYIFEETVLCLWTGILYITCLKANISRVWWKDAIMILLLVTLSIALIFLLLLLIFHRGIPERVYPFSKGVCRNLYDFCFARSSIYSLERLPTAMELEEKSRPYTCLDFLTGRCC